MAKKSIIDPKCLKDEKPKPKKKKVETPLEKRNKIPKFTENYEESLIRQLFEEKENKIKSIDLSSVREQEDKLWVHHKRNGAEWDVPIDEKIEYFDPELSYEITGYRPITMEQGLDFDPEPFRERAAKYESAGKYTEFPQGTKPYIDFWKEEYRRCQEGYSVGKYRITGDHYFFLNYYRMQTVLEGATSGTGREESFPGFLSKQYEFFHYVEMAEKLHKDICILKARGIGFSEIIASLSVRPYTTNKNYNVLLTCASDGKLTPLKNKCWKQMDWLNTNTQGGMRHVRQVANNNDLKRASKLTKDGIELGWMSQVRTIVADSSDKIRGERVDRLFFEECFGEGTKVIMSDYSRKNIEDIVVGDYVLGVDGLPKKVIKTCSGEDDLYMVHQKKGIDYVVNSKHKIYLELRKKLREKKLMTAEQILSLPNSYQNVCYGLSTEGFGGNNDFVLDPYYFGVWLGDGYSHNPNRIIIGSDKDIEIKNYIINYFNSIPGGYIDVYKEGNCEIIYKTGYANGKNPIIQDYKRLNLFENKHIPKEVLNSSIEYKLKVLAGLIDTDGYIKSPNKKGKSFEIEMSRKDLIYQISELARTCGFKTHLSERVRYDSRFKKQTHSYIVTILGNICIIPVLLTRKKVTELRESSVNSTGLKITAIGRGTYYGFTLDNGSEKDHMFFLDDYTIVHNCGSNPKLADSWIKSDALVSLGGIHFGSRIAGGTGGEDMALQGLSDIFNSPEAFNVLPFKNYDSSDGEPELRAFFIPAHKFALSSEYLDKRGVTDHVRFKKFYEEQRKKLKGDKFLTECAEHCFTPEEALSKTGENLFDAELIAARMSQIMTKHNWTEPKKMMLLWDKTTDKQWSKINAYESPHGNVLVVEPPLTTEDGSAYKNLYVAGIDSIDIGQDESASDTDVSDFCIVIKKRIRGMDDPKYVAMYKERPRDIRQAYETAHKLLVWYNCNAMLEATKIGIQRFLEERKASDRLMKRPEYAVSSRAKKIATKKLIGLTATESVIKHGLELVGNFLNDYWYTIDFPDILQQLLKYSYSQKRKFDIVAAMQIECCLRP